MILAWSAFFLWAFGIGTQFLSTLITLVCYRRSDLIDDTEIVGVSIIKPIKGIDPGFEEGVETYFQLDYPLFEILFCLQPGDRAQAVIENLCRKYPFVDANIIISSAHIGPNPKVNNMLEAYENASHDTIWVSDSNTRTSRDMLHRIVTYLKPNVGVVTSVVSGREGRLIGGRLECLFLNGFYARWMYFAAIIGWPFVVGKLMVFRRSTMARIGGLSTLSRYIAEDYMAGVAIRRLGMKIAVMNEPIEQYIGPLTLQKFWSRHIRWGRIRKAQSPLTFLIEPLLSPFFGLGSGLVAIATLFSVSPAIFFSAHLVIWLLCDMAVYIRMEHKMGWTFFFDWLIREPVSLGIWMQSLLGSRINWRGNDLKILPGGLVTPR